MMKKPALFLALLLLPVAFVFGEGAPKLGHINSQELLAIMPDMTKAGKDLTEFSKPLQAELETMSADYEKKVAAFQVAEKDLSASDREARVKEIQALGARMQSYQSEAEAKISKQREVLYKPLLDKADKAIKDVAKEKGFDYVFDTANGSMLFANTSLDLMPLVKAKLGIK